MKMRLSCVWMGLFSLLVAQGAYAQGGWRDLPAGKWWANKRFVLQLRLSRDQQVRIESLWLQNRQNLAAWKSELEKRQLEFTDLLGRDYVDEAAALRAFDRMQEARHNIERATFLMRLQVKNLLSPEQQQKLEAISRVLRGRAVREGDAAPADAPAPGGKRENTAPKKSGY